MSEKHVLDPAPTLVSVPEAVPVLSASALAHNISAHTRSSEPEREALVHHLQHILEIREADLLARALICRESLASV